MRDGQKRKQTAWVGFRYSKFLIVDPLINTVALERLKKYCGQFGARIFGFWRGFGEGAGLMNPVTEPKRSQKPKRPLSQFALPNGYSISLTALARWKDRTKSAFSRFNGFELFGPLPQNPAIKRGQNCGKSDLLGPNRTKDHRGWSLARAATALDPFPFFAGFCIKIPACFVVFCGFLRFFVTPFFLTQSPMDQYHEINYDLRFGIYAADSAPRINRKW